MCAGSDADSNHGLQHRFRQSDCLHDDRLLRLPHLLIAVLTIAGVMAMGAGGILLFGSGFSAASQSLVGPLPGIWLITTGVRWVNESLTQPVGPVRGFRAFESAPPRSLTGPAAPASLTAVRSPDKAVSRPLLLDHAELAAAEEAQREAARARRGGRPIRRRGRARTSEPVASSVLSLHPGRSPVLHSSRQCYLQAQVSASAARSCGAGSSGRGTA